MHNFKVLIAEDEPPALRMIKKIVENHRPGVSVTTVKSAEDALVSIETVMPDILITDIRMSGMDGLELIEKAKQIKTDLLAVIISGHQKFEYAARALKLGIEEYLLKPIDPDEITHVIDRIYSKIIHRRDEEKGYTLRKLLSSKDNDGVKKLYVAEKLNILAVNQSGERANLLELCLQAATVFHEAHLNVAVWKNNIIIIEEQHKPDSDALEQIKNWLKENRDVKSITFVTAKGTDKDSLDTVLPKLYKQSREERVLGRCVDIEYSAKRQNYTDRTVGLKEYVLSGDLEKDKQKYQELFEKCEENLYTTHEVRFIVYDFINSMNQEYSFMIPLSLLNEDIWEGLRFSDSYTDAFAYTWETIERFINKKDRGTAQRKIDIQKLYDNIVAYIQMHLFENYSLKEMAAKFHVSQPYVSRAFRECGNTSYKEYVTNQKLKYAMEYIKDNPDAMIKDIAERIGIEQSYFSTFFYRGTGKNPSEYKNHQDSE